MAQKEVEDIFARTMNKEKFKKENSLRLAISLAMKRKGKKNMSKQQTKIIEEEEFASADENNRIHQKPKLK